MNLRSRSLRSLTFVLVATATLVAGSAASATDGKPLGRSPIGRCTMALPATQTTIGVRMPDAADFCELVSQALSYELFHAQMIVTYHELWHYAHATLSCRLRYRKTPDRITVRNSEAACRWLPGLSPGWHVEAVAVRVHMVGRSRTRHRPQP